jgi:hypothetical protein
VTTATLRDHATGDRQPYTEAAAWCSRWAPDPWTALAEAPSATYGWTWYDEPPGVGLVSVRPPGAPGPVLMWTRPHAWTVLRVPASVVVRLALGVAVARALVALGRCS